MPGVRSTSPLRILVRVSALLAAAALIPAAAAPANCEPDPAAAARQFWEGHSRFYVKADPTLTALTTPRFYSALQREWACIAKNPGCLGYRPWPHPDEKRFGAYPTFYIPVSRPDLSSVIRPEHVLVTMTYALNDADGRSQGFTRRLGSARCEKALDQGAYVEKRLRQYWCGRNDGVM